MRTFKFKAWKQIQLSDLKDETGCYFKTAWDLAIMYPLLEMTGGGGCKFIDDIFYVYNMDNPLNDCVLHQKLQEKTALHIRKKEKYTRLFQEAYSPYHKSLKTTLKYRWITFYKRIITPKVYLLALIKFLKLFRKNPITSK